MTSKKIPLTYAVVCIAILAGMGLAVAAQPAKTSLSDVVREALSTNPDVTEARQQWLGRRAEVRQAEGAYLPSVDVNAGLGVERTNSPGTRSVHDGSRELRRGEFGVNVRQMLYDGWGTRSEVARQQARTDSAASRLLAVGESTAMRAVEAYVDLQRFDALRDIAEESLTVHKRIQDQIRLRSDAGVGRRADSDQVNSRVALAEVNLVAAEVNRRDARTGFRRVVGQAPSGDYAPVAVPAGAVPASYEAALQSAQANNPVVQVASADIEAARAQHEAAKQFDYPRFDLELGGNLNNNLDGTEGHTKDLSAMIRMRYNLYRGGIDDARKEATAFNINEAQAIRDRTLRQLEESLSLAWAAFEATSAQVPLLQRQVASARATRDAYTKQFNIGERTLLDLLNSENEVLQARQAVVQADSDRLLAQFRVLEAMGVLIDTLDAAVALAQPADI